MTAPTAQPSSIAGTLLIAPGAAVPREWQIESDPAGSGWSRVANAFDRFELDQQPGAEGWNFFFMASPVAVTAAGWSGPRTTGAALTRLVAAVKKQRCNCVEIDEIGMRSFLGVPYVRISGHPRNIQRGMVFSGQ